MTPISSVRDRSHATFDDDELPAPLPPSHSTRREPDGAALFTTSHDAALGEFARNAAGAEANRAASRAPLGPEMVPFAQLRTREQIDAAIQREQLFMNTLAAWAPAEEFTAHRRYLGDLLLMRAPPPPGPDAKKQIETLRAELAALGDTKGCRDDDTVASLTFRVNSLKMQKAAANDKAEGERLNIGLDGRTGTRDALDRYEAEQWVAAANPGSGTGALFAGIATARGGSLEEVRAAGQAGNLLEDAGGGVGRVLQQGRRAPDVVHADKGRTATPARARGSIVRDHAPPNVPVGRSGAVAPVDDFNAGGTLPTKGMLPRYAADPGTGKLGENQPGNRLWDGDVVTYLHSEAARAPYKLNIREVTIAGKKEMRIFDANGRLFDTRAATTHWSQESGVPRAIFVMNARGELFASNFQARGQFHHSSLAGGRPVAAAGELRVENGKLVDISNQSGHYMPSDDYTDQTLRVLRARGLDLTGCSVTSAATGATRAIR